MKMETKSLDAWQEIVSEFNQARAEMCAGKMNAAEFFSMHRKVASYSSMFPAPYGGGGYTCIMTTMNDCVALYR